MTQPDLFAEESKLEAIQRAADNSVDFVDAAYAVLERLAYRKQTITSLDVWALYRGPTPKHPRAMGPVFVRAQRAGLIEPTNIYVNSGRASDHNQMLRVWRSRV